MIIYLLFPHFSFFSFPFICRFHPWVPLLLLLVFFDIWPLARERQDFFFFPCFAKLCRSEPDAHSFWPRLHKHMAEPPFGFKMATASLPSVAHRPRSGFADVTETMPRVTVSVPPCWVPSVFPYGVWASHPPLCTSVSSARREVWT